MQKKWTQEAWSEASGIFAQIIGHPFIKELAAGTLDSARFNRYIAQDEVYLGNYGRQMLSFATMMDNAAQRAMFNDFARAGLEGERAMHKLLTGRFGTDLKVNASAVTAAYNAHTESALVTGRRELALAALLPCMWVYGEVGKYILSIEQHGEQNPYHDWISCYASEQMDEGVRIALELTDNLAEQETDERQEKMLEAFMIATELEFVFWDQAYPQPQKEAAR